MNQMLTHACAHSHGSQVADILHVEADTGESYNLMQDARLLATALIESLSLTLDQKPHASLLDMCSCVVMEVNWDCVVYFYIFCIYNYCADRSSSSSSSCVCVYVCYFT
jgi:hypothetical protein